MKRKYKYDIGLVGCWSAPNYGAQLTYYALYKFLTDHSYNVLMIENIKELKVSENTLLFKITPYPSNTLANIFTNVLDLKILNEYCEIFMTGSDQLWNYNIFGLSEVFTLSFAEHNKKKIAYATSFGKNISKTPYDYETKFKFFLNRFDFISVRESEGVDYCRNNLNINSQLMLDPVFLCDLKHYKELSEKSDHKIEQQFIFCYITDQTEEKKKVIDEIARKMNIKLVIVNAYYTQKKEWNFGNIDVCIYDINNCTIEDWMYFIYNSTLVLTDSYHGYCFSLLFQKQVMTLFTNQNKAYRAISLADLFGIGETIGICSNNESKYEIIEINYDIVVEKIKAKQEECKKWLINALQSEVLKNDDNHFWDAFGLEIMNMKKITKKLQYEENLLDLRDKRVVLFGAGSFLDKIYSEINKSFMIDYISDNNPDKWNTFMYDKKQCINPQKLRNIDNLSVIITIKDEGIVKQIESQLNGLGIREIHHISEYMNCCL